MAKIPGITSSAPKGGAARPPAKAAPAAKTAAAPETPKKPFNPVLFAREVRAEARKITWTSRQETWITSVMVFIMVLLTALFFVVVDTVLGHGMQALLKFAA
ncbi:MAG: preprotein translocase subunit SecE [Caulobacteraceae bacterium]|nr:preprotein translocase subunit SecE [Caulobacteraceae bacterium]